jgi:hypothetical protein
VVELALSLPVATVFVDTYGIGETTRLWVHRSWAGRGEIKVQGEGPAHVRSTEEGGRGAVPLCRVVSAGWVRQLFRRQQLGGMDGSS